MSDPAAGGATLSYVNVFCADVERLAGFYRDLFGLAEIAEVRSPIFIGLETGKTRIGFNAPAAYDLLGLTAPAPDAGVKLLLTFEVATRAEVDRLTALATASGARLAKPATLTYYGAYQSVLFDPEGNVLRINALA
jgi:hypothetical protein